MFYCFCEKILNYYFTLVLLIFVLIINVFIFALKEFSPIKFFTLIILMLLIIIAIVFKIPSELLYFKKLLFISFICIFVLRIFYAIIAPCWNSKDIIGKTQNLDLRVLSADSHYDNNTDYENKFLKIFENLTESENINVKTSVIVSTIHGKIALYDNFSGVKQGDILRAEITFFNINPARNPGGFDEKKFYESKGIFLKGKLSNGNFKVIKPGNNILFNISTNFRLKIKETFNSVLPKREAGLLTGIVIGDRSGISKTEKDQLYNAGLSHMTAVSGAAISFLVFPLKKIMKLMKIKIQFRYIVIVLFLIFIGTIAFWTPSVTRAIIMVVSILTSGIIIRKINAYQSLIISALIILYFNPFMLYSAGFILSYCTVSGILIFYKIIKIRIENQFKVSGIISSAVAINISACISSLPAVMYLFNEISLASLISNFFVMPLFQLSVFSGFILALMGILKFPFTLISILAVPVKGILSVVYFIAAEMSDFQFLKIKAGFITVVFLVGAVCVIYSLFSTDKYVKRILYILTCVCIISNSSYYIFYLSTRPDVTIVFADVGQGDSTLIIYKNGKSILIDSGSKQNNVKIINGILDYYNIQFPDIYVATHMHEDHCGAMSEIIKQRGGGLLFVPLFTHEDIINKKITPDFSYKDYYRENKSENPELINGVELLNAAYSSGLKITEVGLGDSFRINDSSKMTFFNPIREDFEGREKGGNESSLVTLFEYNGIRFLIMADATKKVEDRIISSINDLKSYVYRISHHGSPSSTNHDIINAVSAKVSIISVGYNFYGHPSEEVINRLDQSGSAVYRTDLFGALIFEIRGNKVRYKTMLDKEEDKLSVGK